jgi:hypothetical protein
LNPILCIHYRTRGSTVITTNDDHHGFGRTHSQCLTQWEKVEIWRTSPTRIVDVVGLIQDIFVSHPLVPLNMRSISSAILLVAATALAQDGEDFSHRGNFGAPVCG